MRFFRYAALHGLVVSMLAGVIVDFKGGWSQGCGYLDVKVISAGAKCREGMGVP